MPSPSQVTLVPASSIEPRRIDWLWYPWLARREVTIAGGDPGTNKSMTSIDLAARVSTGREAPLTDKPMCEPSDVVMLNAEDDASSTIWPRLDAADADLDRVHLVESVKLNGKNDVLDLERDLDSLAACMGKLQNPTLLIIDPISAYLSHLNEMSNVGVRRFLRGLTEVAKRFDIAVLAITHLNKRADSGSANYKLHGSIAFLAAPRIVMLFGHGKFSYEDVVQKALQGRPAAKTVDDDRRVIVPLKINLAPKPDPLAFFVHSDHGDPHSPPRILWDPREVFETAQDLLSGAETLDPRKFLQRMLHAGPLEVAAIEKAAAAAGISWRTIERAKAAIKAVSIQDRDEQGRISGPAFWRMP